MQVKPFIFFAIIVCHFPIIIYLIKGLIRKENKTIWYLLIHFLFLIGLASTKFLNEIELIKFDITLNLFFIVITFNLFYLYTLKFVSNNLSLKTVLSIVLIPIFIFGILTIFENVIPPDLKTKVIDVKRINGNGNLSFINYLIFLLSTIYVTGLIWVNIKNSFSIIHKNSLKFKVLKKWILPYSILLTLWLLSTLIPGIIVANKVFVFFYFCSIAISLIMAFYLLVSPKLLIDISKSSKIASPILVNSITDEIKDLDFKMTKDNLFLKPEITITDFSRISKKTPDQIRLIIHNNQFLNFKDYLNSFRIVHFKDEIDKGILDTYSIEYVLKKSGFNSHQTMTRVFKKHYNMTAKEYWRKK